MAMASANIPQRGELRMNWWKFVNCVLWARRNIETHYKWTSRVLLFGVLCNCHGRLDQLVFLYFNQIPLQSTKKYFSRTVPQVTLQLGPQVIHHITRFFHASIHNPIGLKLANYLLRHNIVIPALRMTFSHSTAVARIFCMSCKWDVKLQILPVSMETLLIKDFAQCKLTCKTRLSFSFCVLQPCKISWPQQCNHWASFKGIIDPALAIGMLNFPQWISRHGAWALAYCQWHFDHPLYLKALTVEKKDLDIFWT